MLKEPCAEHADYARKQYLSKLHPLAIPNPLPVVPNASKAAPHPMGSLILSLQPRFIPPASSRKLSVPAVNLSLADLTKVELRLAQLWALAFAS